jgi:quercetin dioxygenase-like cupin family protein
LIIRRVDQEQTDRYPDCPRFPIASTDFGHKTVHVGDLSYLPGAGVPHHYHTGRSEESQIMLEGKLECWIDGKRTTVYPGDTVTAPPGIEHAFHNRTDKPARMITAFPTTLPETIHTDDPDLEDVDEHPAIIRAGTRTSGYAEGVEGVERVELSGDFSGAKTTYTYFVDIQPGAAMPVESNGAETVVFVVSGPVVSMSGDEFELGSADAVVVDPKESYGFANRGDAVARLVVIHPFINS